MKKNRLFWIVVIIGLILDQLTKYWVAQTFALGQTIPLLPGIFHLTYVTNTGAAFSLFTAQVEWLKWISLGVILFVMLFVMPFAWFYKLRCKGFQLALGCWLAGALGNTIDRFSLGYVVDFLDFRLNNLPILNLADVLITIGIGIGFGLLLVNFLLPISSD